VYEIKQFPDELRMLPERPVASDAA
jgi:hypothetical protein